jgi:hypothetical protein
MNGKILERDWKVFGELRKVALERLCEKALAEAKREIERPQASAHERYLELYQIIMKRDEEIAWAFNDFRRSTALMMLSGIVSLKLLTDEELQRFSAETQNFVKLYLKR